MNNAGLGNAEFRNGIAIVAGGSGGLGAAICERLAESKVSVALTYLRNAGNAQAAVERLEALGARALAIQTDLTDTNQVQRLVEQVGNRWGMPSTVVYAAGPQLHFRYISKIEPDLFRHTMDQDVNGFFSLVSAVLPSLRETRGALVALSTPAIDRYTKKDILSIAPKAAIHSVVRGIAVEEGRFGVRANSVGVGLVGDAGLYNSLRDNGSIDDKFLEATYDRVPLGRLGRAREIANAVAFLASEQASFVTGHLLMADGGLAA